MGPLRDLLKTHPIQTGWEFTKKNYRSGQFGLIDDLDCQFGKGLGWTLIWTRSDGPEPFVILLRTTSDVLKDY
jgi:hypothetical protein